MSRSNSENHASAFDDTLEDIVELLEENTQHFIYLTGAAGTGNTRIDPTSTAPTAPIVIRTINNHSSIS